MVWKRVVMAVMVLMPAAAWGQVVLSPGKSVVVEWPRSGEARFDPQAKPGAYVVGFLDRGSAGEVVLDLIDPTGKAVRRFPTVGGRNDFRFVADREGLLLRVTGAVPLQGTIGLTLALPIEAQVRPSPAPLSPAIAGLQHRLADSGSIDAFWREVERVGTPLVEAGPPGKAILTFLARGAERNVRILGAPSGDHDEMWRLEGTDIWYRSYVVPDDTRLSYKLASDVPQVPGTAREQRVAILATAQSDPLNRHPWPKEAVDRFNQESTVALARAPAQPWLEVRDVPHGTLTRFMVSSGRLGNRREITLYRPPGFDPKADNLLLFVFDAPEYLSKVPTPTMLDNMLAAGALPPVVGVFIANPDREARSRELPGNDAFADFIAEELLLRVLAETGLKSNPARTVLAGSSFGGLAAATVAQRHPDRFGTVLGLSGSFWWHPPGADETSPNEVAARFAQLPRLPLRFFLSAGLFEATSPSHGYGILETSRHLRDVLVARGYDVTYREYAGGHDYLVWRGALADGLLALFGKR